MATYSGGRADHAHLLDSDYMKYEIAAAALPIGRFIPASLQGAGSIVNRVATGGCVGDSFTYMGEQLRLSVQLMAPNAAGGVTRKLPGQLCAPGAGADWCDSPAVRATPGAVSDGVDLSARLVLGDVTLSSPAAGGRSRYRPALRVAARPDGLYDETRLALTLSDADGVPLQVVDTISMATATADHVDWVRRVFAAAGVARHAHGSESARPRQPLSIQYFAGANVGLRRMRRMTARRSRRLCSAMPMPVMRWRCRIPASSTRRGSAGKRLCGGYRGCSAPANAQAGEFALNLLAPGAGRTGAVRVSVTPRPGGVHWGRR